MPCGGVHAFRARRQRRCIRVVPFCPFRTRKASAGFEARAFNSWRTFGVVAQNLTPVEAHASV